MNVDKGILQWGKFYNAFEALLASGKTRGMTPHEIIQELSHEAIHVMFTSDLVKQEVTDFYTPNLTK